LQVHNQFRGGKLCIPGFFSEMWQQMLAGFPSMGIKARLLTSVQARSD
jgi:hypothetical protein